jgi:hypothetical protein
MLRLGAARLNHSFLRVTCCSGRDFDYVNRYAAHLVIGTRFCSAVANHNRCPSDCTLGHFAGCAVLDRIAFRWLRGSAARALGLGSQRLLYGNWIRRRDDSRHGIRVHRSAYLRDSLDQRVVGILGRAQARKKILVEPVLRARSGRTVWSLHP